MDDSIQKLNQPSISFEHEALFKRLIFFGTAALILIGGPLLMPALAKLKGKGLNSNAWRASFWERSMIPPPGPREGWWGVHLAPVQDPVVGIHLPERKVPGMFDIDSWGVQRAQSSDHPDFRILIMGGSVAAGAYASNLNRTYFEQLAYRLGGAGHRVEIDVYGTGAWTSANTLSALRLHGLALHPDYVVFFDGLNDVTLNKNLTEAQRVQTYLDNTRAERDLALAQGAKVIFAPQPFLPDKPIRTGLEELILYESYQPVSGLVQAYNNLRAGLQQMVIPGKVYYVDTTLAIARGRRTIFADIWHFSDIGHAAVGRYLAHTLNALLTEDENRRGIVHRTPPLTPFACSWRIIPA